jgi:hypothetical protein
MSELGSWVGLYHWVIEKLMIDRMTAERDVLTVLAMRANPLGFCWPGVGYIAGLIGRADSTVENALTRLELMGYIAVVRTQNIVRGRTDIDYQVRPDVMFIHPSRFDEASKLWQQNCNVNITIVMKESQPTPKNQNQEQAPGTSTKTNNNNKQLSVSGKSSDETANPATPAPENANPEKPEKNSGGAPIPKPAPHGAIPNPPAPRSAAPPSPLVCYDEALPDELAESVAARMNAATRYMMALAVARGLVVKYGVTKCEAALVHMGQATGIDRPAGFLRSTIERGEIDPVADGKIPVEPADAKVFTEYIGGKYADYIKSQPDESDIKIDKESHDE